MRTFRRCTVRLARSEEAEMVERVDALPTFPELDVTPDEAATLVFVAERPNRGVSRKPPNPPTIRKIPPRRRVADPVATSACTGTVNTRIVPANIG